MESFTDSTSKVRPNCAVANGIGTGSYPDLFKRFALNERTGFEFRAEAFNVFNHTQWAPIAGEGGSAASNGASSGTNGCGGSDFFSILAAHNPRILQLGMKFYF